MTGTSISSAPKNQCCINALGVYAFTTDPYCACYLARHPKTFIGKRRRHEQKHKAYLLSLPFCKRECLSAPDRSVHTYVFRRVMALPGMLFYTRAEESEGIRPSHFGMSQIRNWVTTESYLILSKASSFAFLYSVFNITWDNKWPFETETIINNSNKVVRRVKKSKREPYWTAHELIIKNV